MHSFHIVFIHSPVHGHLDSFYNLALVQSTAVKRAYVGISPCAGSVAGMHQEAVYN